MKEACEYLDFPVVSGNVSFYNGTNKKNIYPTPVIGGVGLIKDLNKIQNKDFKSENSKVILVGKTFGHLYQSAFYREVYSINEGPPPDVNLMNEKNNGEMILKLIEKKLVNAVHDVSTGGLIVALAEMCLKSSIGFLFTKQIKKLNKFQYLFGEDQGRYLIEVSNDNLGKINKLFDENNTYREEIGITQKNFFEFEDEFKIDIKSLLKINNEWYYKY